MVRKIVDSVAEPAFILLDIAKGNIDPLPGFGLFLLWVGKASLVLAVVGTAVAVTRRLVGQ